MVINDRVGGYGFIHMYILHYTMRHVILYHVHIELKYITLYHVELNKYKYIVLYQ
jgi:hypothetical protein